MTPHEFPILGLTWEVKDIGSKVVVFDDHLELHSRHGSAERRISLLGILDVVRRMRFAWTDVEIQSFEGPPVVLRGCTAIQPARCSFSSLACCKGDDLMVTACGVQVRYSTTA